VLSQKITKNVPAQPTRMPIDPVMAASGLEEDPPVPVRDVAIVKERTLLTERTPLSEERFQQLY
jgi:hypothetical protein